MRTIRTRRFRMGKKEVLKHLEAGASHRMVAKEFKFQEFQKFGNSLPTSSVISNFESIPE